MMNNTAQRRAEIPSAKAQTQPVPRPKQIPNQQPVSVPAPPPSSPSTTQAELDDVTRVEGGWRNGRPIEDPEKTKTWGYVSAKPSEYLVHMRNGRVLTSSSGQGATCFKWRRDSVAVIPTSLQRLNFVADQVTLEKVGISIRGLAVFRIADPMLAFRVLNFSYPERAQEKLCETLSDMLTGATRRLVANLSVDECLTKRKHALADELLQEVAPVVGGTGSLTDATEQGWGVVLDTIEIQEVRVLSSKLFHQMQAPYRTELERKAEIARAAFQKESRLRSAKDQHEIDGEELARARTIDHARAEVEREKSERAKALALLRVQNQSEVETQALQANATLSTNKSEMERRAQAQKLEHERRMEERRNEGARVAQNQKMTHDFTVAQRKLETDAELVRRRAEETRAAELAEVERERVLELERMQRRDDVARRDAELEAERVQREAAADLERIEKEREVEARQTAIAAAALEQQAALEREQAQREVEASAELVRLEADAARASEIAEVERERALDVERLKRKEELARREAELAAIARERHATAELTRLETERNQLLAWLDLESTAAQEQAAQDALAKARLQADLERDEMLQKLAHEKRLMEMSVLRERAEIAVTEAAAKAQLIMAEKLPELASAVGQKFGEIKLTQIGGGGEGLNVAPAVRAVGELLALAKTAISPSTEGDD